MEKRIKYFFSMVCMLMMMGCVACLTSCKDDDDDDDGGSHSSSLVGTWVCEYKEGGDVGTMTLVFKSNGTGTFEDSWDYYYNGQHHYESDRVTFTWSTIGNKTLKVKIHWENTDTEEDEFTHSYTISGNKLIMPYIASDDSGEYIFTRQ